MEDSFIERLWNFWQFPKDNTYYSWWEPTGEIAFKLLDNKTSYSKLFDQFGYGTLINGQLIRLSKGLNCPGFWEISQTDNYKTNIVNIKNAFLENTSLKLDDIAIDPVCALYGEKHNEQIIPPVFFRIGLQVDFLTKNLELKPNDKVLEIGSGFGGMPLLLKRKVPGIKYICCDIPHALMIQGTFLQKLGYKVVFCNEIADENINEVIDNHEFDFLMILPEFMTKINTNINLCINTDSFPEMDHQTIVHYLNVIFKNCLNFYSSNNVVFENGGYYHRQLDNKLSNDVKRIKSRVNVNRDNFIYMAIGMNHCYREELYVLK